MTAADHLPAIIQAMQDAAHEAGDLVLASALALTTSPAEVAPLLPLTGADAMQGAGLYALTLDPEVSGATAASLGAADHALACRVAARLASTACLILAIDAKGHHDAAGALWLAAAHLTALPTTTVMLYGKRAPGMTDLMVSPEAVDEVVAAISDGDGS